MISFISIAAVVAFTLGIANTTPLAGGAPDNSLAKRATVICHSNNAVLQAMRDPGVSADASKFCSTYIQSRTTTTLTTNTTSYISTQTVTPAAVVVTETNTTCVKALPLQSNRATTHVMLIPLQVHSYVCDRHWGCQALGSRKT